ncbi:MAG: PD-(D/E)XK nuclease domain-containing protein, partial [Muribaculaceae bacterium]|nr:PD-(D/E)XK nuclease domain-containing protein [Muribaculaceae bacterium]
TPALAERHGYRGRSDLEVFAGRNVYIFEFKYNKSLQEAMDQIRDRDYAGRYAMDPRQIYLIGANFIEDADTRRLEYEIVTINS